MRKKRIGAGILMVCSLVLTGCGLKGASQQSQPYESSAPKEQAEAGQTGAELTEAVPAELDLQGELVNAYQTQQILNPVQAQGFGGWILGSSITANGLYYLFQPSMGPDADLRLYQVPLEELYQEDVLSGYYPAVSSLQLTRQLTLPEQVAGDQGNPAGAECVWRFFRGGSGDLYYLTCQREQNALYLYHVDETGQELSRTEVTEALQDMPPREQLAAGYLENDFCAVDEQGRIYLTELQEEKLWILDSQGELLHRLTLPQQTQQLIALQDGQIYLVTGEGAGSRIMRLDGETGNTESVMDVPRTIGRGALVPGQGNELLYRDQSMLYFCDPEQESAESAAIWEKLGIDGAHILQAWEITEGKIYVLEDDYSLTQVSQIDIRDVPAEKQTVTLAVVRGYNDYLNQAVVEFNKRNAYYEVEIIDYDYFEGPQKLETELATGKAPDLLDMNLLYADKLVKKGLLTDLSPYLEDGKGIEREDLVEAVLRCNTIDGVLTCIPGNFALEVLVGKPQVVGSEPGWTLEEYTDCIREHMGLEVMGSNRFASGSNQSGHAIPELPMRGDIAHWADYQQGKALFDREDFRELLELAEHYQVTVPAVDLTSALELEDGRMLTYVSALFSMEDYLLLNASLQKEITYKGYPTEDGSPAYSLISAEALAINAGSQVQDGAWALIEFLMTYHLPDVNQDGGFQREWFSALESRLNFQMQSSMTKSYQRNADYELVYDQEGQLIETTKYTQNDFSGKVIAESPAATQEDVDNLRRLIDAAAGSSDTNSNTLFQIVYEEIDAFLEGQRTAGETLDVIQNRVQLFMDENK